MSERPPIFKTILIGEGGVGKTSLTLRYTEDTFDEAMKMTIGVNFASKKINVDNTDVNLILWDLGGQPRFRDIVGDYFRGAKAAICVYDATRYISLDHLREWIGRVKENSPNCKLLFVANKIDQRVDGTGVTQEAGLAFAQEFDAPMMEVSAKTGEGVIEMFESLTRMLLGT
ncbi:MAG: Rab family GTPase [Candidatus Thorarchaeota archaeon]